LRFVAEALGATVAFDAVTRVVRISMEKDGLSTDPSDVIH